MFRASAKGTIVPSSEAGPLRYGVSLYSYSGDLYTSMTLEDAMADIADMGATGIEILGEGNIPGYPAPSPEWVDSWHALLEKYSLTATNYGSWIDTAMWRHRDLTAEEGAAQLQLDLRLAARLGFTSVRPKFGVTSFELEPHPIWQETVRRSLDLAQELDIVICPEIHAPTPIKHPVTQGYLDFLERTGSGHFKLLIDTGIFQTAAVDEPHEGVELGKDEKRPPFLEPLAVPASDLAEIIDHVYFIQAKFFEVDDNLADLHVPWSEIMSVLTQTGWAGWLSSEYEGRREPYRGRDQFAASTPFCTRSRLPIATGLPDRRRSRVRMRRSISYGRCRRSRAAARGNSPRLPAPGVRYRASGAEARLETWPGSR